jgi:hypothetical protein
MHGSDFRIDVDVGASGQVNDPSMLNIGINDGVAINDSSSIGANRLLIFTGTALNTSFATSDANLKRGILRIRLRFALGKSAFFRAAAAFSALSGLHGESDDDVTFDVNAATVVTDPTDCGSLPQPVPPLPAGELYLILDAACQGGGARLSYVSYQANVLIQDLEPDLDSILVRPSGSGPFASSAAFTLPDRDTTPCSTSRLTLQGRCPLTSRRLASDCLPITSRTYRWIMWCKSALPTQVLLLAINSSSAAAPRSLSR